VARISFSSLYFEAARLLEASVYRTLIQRIKLRAGQTNSKRVTSTATGLGVRRPSPCRYRINTHEYVLVRQRENAESSAAMGLWPSTKRNVWLFARPLSGYGIFPASAMATTSHGHFYLCHWGVLVTPLSIVDIKAIVLRDGQRGWSQASDLELGIMWELHRLPDDKNTVNKTNPFQISTFKTQWPTCSGQYIGETSCTVAKIQLEGMYLTAEPANDSIADCGTTSGL